MSKLKHILLSAMVLVGSLNASDQAERKLIRHQDPEYPPVAAKMNLRGTVKLKVWINPDGSVRRLEYLGGHPLLTESALKAVKGWQFEPSSKESTEIVEVKF